MRIKNLIFTIALNILITTTCCEILFTGYYFVKDGRYLSVIEKISLEKSSFDVETSEDTPCNKHGNVLVPHPYFVFVHTSRPECHSFANNSGHRGPDIPLEKDPHMYTVMILGGSVANQIYQLEKQKIKEYFQKKHPGKKILLLNGSLEGWKQPQQLLMLQSYGQVLDAAISIEGFNEMIFNRRLNYALRFDTPFLPGYRKANAQFQTEDELLAVRTSYIILNTLQHNPLLSHSKTAYFLSEVLRATLAKQSDKKDDLESLPFLKPIFTLPQDLLQEKKRALSIDEYQKYTQFMISTAESLHIQLAIFMQPTPAIEKALTSAEQKVVGDLSYKDDYLLFSNELLKNKSVYSLLNVFSDTNETIYKDGIHFYKDSSGGEKMTDEIFNTLDKQWH